MGIDNLNWRQSYTKLTTLLRLRGGLPNPNGYTGTATLSAQGHPSETTISLMLSLEQPKQINHIPHIHTLNRVCRRFIGAGAIPVLGTITTYNHVQKGALRWMTTTLVAVELPVRVPVFGITAVAVTLVSALNTANS